MKKKIKKDDSKKKFQYTKELEGLLLILVGLIGFINTSVVGNIVSTFAVFLFGNWYVLALICSLVLGAYLLAKRKSPNYFSARLIGVYTVILSVLIISHLEFIKNTDKTGLEILKITINNIMLSSDNFELLRDTGGGMIGALFSVGFVKLFSFQGTLIVTSILTIFGIIMLFNINIGNIFVAIFKPIKSIFKKRPKKSTSLEVYEDDAVEKDDNNRKVVITSIDDLDRKPTESIIERKEVYEELPHASSKEYTLPPVNLLDMPVKKGKVNSNEFITSNTKILERVLNDFQVYGKVTEVHVGPTVTQYEIELKAGTKVTRVLSINREIALALAAKDVRVQAPIPGKSTIGIEIPNAVQSDVRMREIIEGIPKKYANIKLVAPLGMDIMGNIQFALIDKMPHLLIAGSTGSGKSVCINNIIMSILMRCKPSEVKLVLIDPKKVELNVYEGVPHLLKPVVTDPKKASITLQKLVEEMDNRYTLFHDSETKSLDTYNEYVDKINKKHPNSLERLPSILIIIDELADLMLVASKEVEESITRITQLARAAGIYLIVATQRPSTDVITGLIKANIPSRISFSVSSAIDSRTILDMSGAEKLLGKGDMLFLPMGENTPIRIQGSFVSDDEIKRVVDAVKKNGEPIFDECFSDNIPLKESSYASSVDEEDPLYKEILSFAIKTGKISASLIQRKYHLGYNRAARIIDLFEEKGIVGASCGSKPRTVLVKLENKEEE
ncbi:MAG: DNA translocase FtsK [Bacilli bacterium]